MSVTNPESPPDALPRLPEELVASTAFLLKRLGFTAKEKAIREYESTGFSPYHHAILVALEEDTHETQGSIADALGYDRGQLVGLLDELEERGLVERRRWVPPHLCRSHDRAPVLLGLGLRQPAR